MQNSFTNFTLAFFLILSSGCRIQVGVKGTDSAIIDEIESGNSITSASIAHNAGIELRASGKGFGDGNVDLNQKYFVSIDSSHFGGFMAEYKKDLESLLASHGASINGRGLNGSPDDLVGFSFDYSRGSRDGFIKVFSVALSNDTFTVILVCYEHD